MKPIALIRATEFNMVLPVRNVDGQYFCSKTPRREFIVDAFSHQQLQLYDENIEINYKFRPA
jgi:hypothetical protein